MKPIIISGRSRSRHSTSKAWLTGLRWAAAIVFVVFGAGKFVNHASELASFRLYGLPAPFAFVYFIGVLEIVGGLLLASRVLVRVAAVALAGDMVGAIIVSGLGQGEDISLTLAPALLVTMIVLIRTWTPAYSREWRHGPGRGRWRP